MAGLAGGTWEAFTCPYDLRTVNGKDCCLEFDRRPPTMRVLLSGSNTATLHHILGSSSLTWECADILKAFWSIGPHDEISIWVPTGCNLVQFSIGSTVMKTWAGRGNRPAISVDNVAVDPVGEVQPERTWKFREWL